jgi:hypothetical protein
LFALAGFQIGQTERELDDDGFRIARSFLLDARKKFSGQSGFGRLYGGEQAK